MFCPIQTNIFNIFMMYENRKFSYIREVRLHLDISTFLNSGETPQVCENPSPAPTLYTSTPPPKQGTGTQPVQHLPPLQFKNWKFLHQAMCTV